MNTKLLKETIGLTILGSTILLGGCMGNSNTTDSENVQYFSDTNTLTQEEKSKLDKEYNSILKKDAEAIKAAEYTVNNVMLKDLDKEFFYGGILSMNTDTIYQQQLKYFEVHREYMRYLENHGANKETLLLRNRMFKNYIDTFQGRSIDGKPHVKRTLIKLFNRYNVLELAAIEKNEKGSITKLLEKERKHEKKVKMWEWFQKPKNANYHGDILVYTNVKFDLLEPSDQESTEKLVEYLEKEAEIRSNFKSTSMKSSISELKSLIKKIDELRFNDDAKWIKQRGLNLVAYDIKYLTTLKTGTKFDVADLDFLTEVNREEDLVSIVSFKDGLKQQSEKRKALKEKMDK